MFGLHRLKQLLLKPRPITADHRPPVQPAAAVRVDELPPFSLPTADLMRFDPQIRIGLGARNGILLQGEVEIASPDAKVAAWLTRQWRRIWEQHGHQLIKAKLYGYLPLEVMYRDEPSAGGEGLLEIDHLRDQHPRTARPLVWEGRIVGFELKGDGQAEAVKVLAPKALVCTFDAEFGNPYGCSLLERAYPPWFEKWTDGGAKKTLRLRMMKDAYIGDILWYPADRQVQTPDGRSVSWRDLASDILANRLTGGAMTLPLAYDDQGHRLMDYTPPQDVSGGTSIFQWKQDVDREIWKALEMPPEVIEASTSGSGYSGRSIPLTIALAAVQAEFNELVTCVDRDIFRPLVKLNFGPAKYELHPRSFMEIFARG